MMNSEESEKLENASDDIDGSMNEQHRIIDTILSTFAHRWQSGNDPIGIWCNFFAYSELAGQVSREANEYVLWTMNGSPLEVDYPMDTYLSRQDIEFQNIQRPQSGKQRIVVFDSELQATKYRNCVGEPHRSRKGRFEKSIRDSGGELYFTTQDILVSTFEATHNLDIGFVMPRSNIATGVIFQSDFTANIQSPKRDHRERTIFFPYSYSDPSNNMERVKALVTHIYNHIADLLSSKRLVESQDIDLLFSGRRRRRGAE